MYSNAQDSVVRNSRIAELNINFEYNYMHVTGGGLDEIINKETALNFLYKDNIYLGNQNNLININGKDMVKLKIAIRKAFNKH